ncbi:hypothetical protein [Sphingomonas parapaucimobilis]|uniref:hypothetical protein n=1 Tax=Sphingomonas parapaucimobilis TaxID=28213 RepID=UPI0035C81122
MKTRWLAGTAMVTAMGAAISPATAQTVTPKAAAEPASPASTAYPTSAAGDGNTVAGYNQSRWAEDWRKYCDPSKRDDVIDALKCVKLTEDGKSYVTFSGELRTRVNITTNPNLREVQQQRQDIAPSSAARTSISAITSVSSGNWVAPNSRESTWAHRAATCATSWPCNSSSPR